MSAWLVDTISLTCGLLVAAVLGTPVGWFLDKAIRITIPDSLKTTWTIESTGVGWLGFFERLLFAVSAWAKEYTLAAGWLVFKLGSKWQGWQHIVQLAADSGISLEARHAWASKIATRFLLGTLVNLLIGLLAGGFARNVVFVWLQQK